MPTNTGYTKKSRTTKGSASDLGNIGSYESNAYAGAKKVMKAGPEFMKQDANAFISGRDVSAGGPVSPGSILYLYNNTAATAWVSLSTATIALAPSSFADGIPLKPNDWTVLNAGENSFIRTSAATVGLYEPKDDSVLRAES